jgi:tetratricopeptide (TPR) repeat protein
VEKSLALDREDTLKKAEKLLRQGRLDGAIVEYVRVVEDQPRDWNTANTLGDLYVRANQSDKAVAQYARIADHFFQDGFYPKAAALYKKILKIAPDDEPAQLHLADISVRLGLMADAKSYLTAVGARRRARGDTPGANEIVVRLGTVDPADIEARLAGARVLANSGDQRGAALRFRDVYTDLLDKGRGSEALQALREAVKCNPADREGRAILARTAVAAGDFEAARGYLDRETAGDDPALLVALVDLELRAGQLDQARAILPQLFAIDRELRHKIVELGWMLTDSNPAAAFVCIDAAVDASLSASEFDDAASILQEFVTRIPTHVPALMRLVEICVDGGLEAAMYEAQAQLADAYLSTSQAAEARVIAEDLVAREPWEGAHIERFRRALVMLRVPEPDTVIAERLSGQTPFMATDHFSESPRGEPSPPPPVAPVAPEPQPEPEPIAEIPAAKPRPAAPKLVPPPSASSGKAKPRDSDEIDLTSALLELQGPAPASSMPSTPPSAPAAGDLEDVFTGIRKEGSRKAAADQSAQHMKLARTYLEMGMIDEAVNALKTASRSPRQRFEAGSVLARLYKEQGDIPAAIEWFERAAQAPAPTTEEGLALLYDLGLTLEEAGETSRALAVFLELQADAGDYRDVPQRADRLARVQTGG